MAFVDIEDGELFYEVRGDGPWLVLIHGAWASHEWWKWQVPELARFYRVFSYDLRGHGRSSPLLRPTSIDAFARGLESVLQKVGAQEFALVGWSVGGMISLQYAFGHPHEVKALVLIATRGNRDPRLKRRVQLQYLTARLSLMVDLAAPRKYDHRAQTFPDERERIEDQIRVMFSPSTPPEVFGWIMADLARHPREKYFEIAKTFWDWEAGEELGKISLPTLIVVGEKDEYTPPDYSRYLQRRIPNSNLVIVEGAGHGLPLERPEKVNQEIIGFLKKAGYEKAVPPERPRDSGLREGLEKVHL